MTKTEYRQYIGSPEWKVRRTEYLSTHCSCARCYLPRWLAIVAYDQDLNVHHRSYANLRCEQDRDLEALCRRCHEVETFGSSIWHAPQSSKCEHCGERHFNRFNSFCEQCQLDFYADSFLRDRDLAVVVE